MVRTKRTKPEIADFIRDYRCHTFSDNCVTKGQNPLSTHGFTLYFGSGGLPGLTAFSGCRAMYP